MCPKVLQKQIPPANILIPPLNKPHITNVRHVKWEQTYLDVIIKSFANLSYCRECETVDSLLREKLFCKIIALYQKKIAQPENRIIRWGRNAPKLHKGIYKTQKNNLYNKFTTKNHQFPFTVGYSR